MSVDKDGFRIIICRYIVYRKICFTKNTINCIQFLYAMYTMSIYNFVHSRRKGALIDLTMMPVLTAIPLPQ